MSDQTKAAIMPTDIPQQTQRQDSVYEQVKDLHGWAVRLGMYDAADWMQQRARWVENGREVQS